MSAALDIQPVIYLGQREGMNEINVPLHTDTCARARTHTQAPNGFSHTHVRDYVQRCFFSFFSFF